MKKSIYLLVLLNFTVLSFYSQNNIKVDTILGENGIFKRFKSKEISEGQKINFNLKISFTGNDLQGKPMNGTFFINTKHGYVGVAQTKDFVFDTNDKRFALMVFSNSMQNFTFTTDRKGKKTVMSMPFNPNNKKQKLDIVKSKETPKVFNAFNLKSFPYKNENGATKGLLYFTDANLSNTSKFSNQIGYAGLGFYQVGNKTVLCTTMETGNSSFTIDKIEAINISINVADFKKEDLGISPEMMKEMMKKMKKQ